MSLTNNINEKRACTILQKFEEFKNQHVEQSPAIAAIRTLIYSIGVSEGSTVNYLAQELRETVDVLRGSTGKCKLAVVSASVQFIRFATLNLATIESEDMATCKKRIEMEGGKYLQRCENSIDKITKRGVSFIFDGAKLLVHSHSRVVLAVLKSVPENIQFQVFITTSDPDGRSDAEEYRKMLSENPNIKCDLIYDSEAASIMESIDLVLVGAEAVVKNGGIINKVGTLSLAICAKEMNKPMYVFAESFKFSLLYPLNQSDIPSEFRLGADGKVRVDYTPPKYLTLVITDRGLLTPTAVCDELIEMYT